MSLITETNKVFSKKKKKKHNVRNDLEQEVTGYVKINDTAPSPVQEQRDGRLEGKL